MVKVKKRTAKVITNKDDIDFLLNIKPSDITMSFIMDMFGEFNGKRRFNTYDIFTVPKEGYFFMRVRASLVPVVNFSSYAGYFSILVGFMFGALSLVWLGILCEIAILGFQLVTLPVELNAIKRALKKIKEYGLLEEGKEIRRGRRMLRAAAMTYVASVATTLIQILRLVLIVGRRND